MLYSGSVICVTDPQIWIRPKTLSNSILFGQCPLFAARFPDRSVGGHEMLAWVVVLGQKVRHPHPADPAQLRTLLVLLPNDICSVPDP